MKGTMRMNTNAFLDLVRKTVTPPGTAAAWWLGQMGYWIKMGETLLSIDYYAQDASERRIAPPVPADQVQGIDLFLGTHDHLDHIDRASWRIWKDTCPDAAFIASRAHLPSLEREEGIPAERLIGHEFLDRDPQTGVYPHLQYLLEGNGVVIYHAGDTLRYEGMLGKLQAFPKIDAALFPINGRDAKRYRSNIIGNMTYQEAADLVGELRPRLSIPGHWDMFEYNGIDPTLFTDYVDAKYADAVPCLIPAYQETIWIRA